METKLFLVLPLIVLFPALGALVVGLLGRRWGDRFAAVAANAALFTSFGLTVYAWWFLMGESKPTAYVWTLYSFLDTGFLKLDVSFLMDRLSCTMALVVTGVSSFIHLYSAGYMKGDRSFARYFSHLNMFVFFMLLLVLGKNLVVMFVGWEGVGLCSYLLIGFWYEDEAKALAGKKAFIVNRIGDFGFLLGMLFLALYAGGTLDFPALEQWAAGAPISLTNETNATVICLLLFLGAIGKSAQFPLYVWLPDAMAGPTPVSALIHAATMVTAGVYMVARMSFLFTYAPLAMAVVAGVGAFTALFAATIGLAQRDIKKVLAYSTVSQLGLMFLAVGSGAYAAGIFHLTTHAFFKACLFLGAGSVIHALHGEQDIFKMGGLRPRLPVTHAAFLVSTLAIAGLPPLSGFFSKDEILNAAVLAQTPYPVAYKLFWAAALAGAFLTALYMMRLYWLTFRTPSRFVPETLAKVHESPWNMATALVVLALGAAVAGFLGLPGEMNLFQAWLGPVVGKHTLPSAPVSALAHWGLVLLSVLLGAGGLAAGWMLYRDGPEGRAAKLGTSWRRVHRVLSNKYYVDELYGLVIVRPVKALAAFCYEAMDAFAIDFVGVRGTAFVVKALGVVPRMFHTGRLHAYLFGVVVGLFCLWLFL